MFHLSRREGGRQDGDGLGNSWSEYEQNFVSMGRMMRFGMKIKYKKSDPQAPAFADFGNYFKVMAPRIQTTQPGSNPAFRLAEACMMHRDPQTLTYVDEPLYDMWDYNIATDTPPLWHVKKKNTLYYNGIGRGTCPSCCSRPAYWACPTARTPAGPWRHSKMFMPG